MRSVPYMRVIRRPSAADSLTGGDSSSKIIPWLGKGFFVNILDWFRSMAGLEERDLDPLRYQSPGTLGRNSRPARTQSPATRPPGPQTRPAATRTRPPVPHTRPPLTRPSSPNTRGPQTFAPPEVTHEERARAEVRGLNFMDAITAHQRWKARLASHIEGISTERLDEHIVCRDDQCELGRWINGPGGGAYGHLRVFCQLKSSHASFHLAAANIVRLRDQGRADLARDALRNGDYPKCSIRVQGLLSTLFLELRAGTGKDATGAAPAKERRPARV